MKRIKLIKKQFGDGQRLLNQEQILDYNKIILEPIEYDDIDNEVINFFNNNVNLVDDFDKKIPTFKLFSNQRFSEYSQTWEHTDEDGNLLMNFKTINREINPQNGTLHNNLCNIPGSNRFTVRMREILDDTGIECYEVTSMSQPIPVDIKYTLNLIASKIELINEFNMRILQLFQSIQCYVQVKGHYMPIKLDTISDESQYEVENRKFYNQSVSMTLLGYVIPKNDIKVELKPKRTTIDMGLKNHLPQTYVDMEYIDENDDTKVELNITLQSHIRKVTFSLDDNIIFSIKEKVNANNIRVLINGDIIPDIHNFSINKNDEITILITKPSPSKVSNIIFSGKILL